MNSNEMKALMHFAYDTLETKYAKAIADAIIDEIDIAYPILDRLMSTSESAMENGIQIKSLVRNILIEQLKNDEDCDINAYNAALISEHLDRCLDAMDDDDEDIYESTIKLTFENKTFGNKEFKFYWSAQFYDVMHDAMNLLMCEY